MYNDPTGLCYACEKGVSCSKHQLGKRYDPLKGTMAMNGAKFINKASMNPVRVHKELAESVNKHNRASDIFYTQAKARAQAKKDEEDEKVRIK